MREGDFRPHNSQSPRPIFMKLEIYNYFRMGTRMQNFRGHVDVHGLGGWVASVTHKSLVILYHTSFSQSSDILTHSSAQYAVKRRSSRGSSFSGSKR